MKKTIITIITLLAFTACSQVTQQQMTDHFEETSDSLIPTFQTGDVATFAGGCFWCMEPPFQELQGVMDVVVGYAGGTEEEASYKQVTTGQTGHREAAQINYDPEMITYQELLDIFFRQIDPTDDGGQFADRGFQYTTAIYYHDQEQKELAKEAIKLIESMETFENPVVTEIVPFSNFFLAEEYHQDFYIKSADHYERYKKGSGRADFIEENWAKEAALEFSR